MSARGAEPSIARHATEAEAEADDNPEAKAGASARRAARQENTYSTLVDVRVEEERREEKRSSAKCA